MTPFAEKMGGRVDNIDMYPTKPFATLFISLPEMDFRGESLRQFLKAMAGADTLRVHRVSQYMFMLIICVEKVWKN